MPNLKINIISLNLFRKFFIVPSAVLNLYRCRNTSFPFFVLKRFFSFSAFIFLLVFITFLHTGVLYSLGTDKSSSLKKEAQSKKDIRKIKFNEKSYSRIIGEKRSVKKNQFLKKKSSEKNPSKIKKSEKKPSEKNKLFGKKKSEGKTVSLEPYSFKKRLFFPGILNEEWAETSSRRFEVIFFISLPFSAVISAGFLQGLNLTFYNSNTRNLPYSLIMVSLLSASLISGLLAYHDTKIWEKMKKLREREIKKRIPQDLSQNSTGENRLIYEDNLTQKKEKYFSFYLGSINY